MPGPTITAPRPATALVPPSLLLEQREPGIETDHCSTGPVTITVARPLQNWVRLGYPRPALSWWCDVESRTVLSLRGSRKRASVSR